MSENTYPETPSFVTKEYYDILFKKAETFRNENVRLTNRVQSLMLDANRIETSLTAFIRENYEGNEELMNELITLFELDMTKNINFVVEVRFEGTAAIPFYMDVDAAQEAIEGNFRFSAEYQGMELDEVYVDEVDCVFSDFEED